MGCSSTVNGDPALMRLATPLLLTFGAEGHETDAGKNTLDCRRFLEALLDNKVKVKAASVTLYHADVALVNR